MPTPRSPGLAAARPQPGSLRQTGRLWLICGALVLATLLAAAAAAIALYQRSRETQRREIVAIGNAAAVSTQHFVQVIDLALHDIQQQVIAKGITTPAGFDQAMSTRGTFDLLRMRGRYLAQTDALAVIDSSGRLISTTRAFPAPVVDLSDRDYFRRLRDQGGDRLFFSAPVIARLSRWPAVIIARRLETPDGRFLGVAAAVLDIGKWKAFYASAMARRGQGICLRRSDGRLLVAWPPAYAPSATVRPEAPWQATAGHGGGVIERGAGRLTSVHPLAKYPLVLDVSLSDATALAPWRREATAIAAVGVTAALGIVLLFNMIARQLGGLATANAELERTSGLLRESEARLRDFAHTASDWFWELGPDLAFVGFGPGLDAGAACAPPTHAGKYPWDVHDSDLDAGQWERIRSLMLARQPFRDIAYRRLGPEGEIQHVSASGIPVFGETGAFLGYRGTTRDISVQKDLETDLRAAKERAESAERLLADAVAAISEGFVIYDPDDRLVMCNESYLTLYNRSRYRMLPGTSFEAILREGLMQGEYADAIGCEEEWLARRLVRHRAAIGATEHTLSDGRTLLVTDRRMGNGGIAGLRIDITALKQAQDALRASEERLARAQEIARIGSWEFDIASQRYTWSREMYRLRGLPEQGFDPTAESLASYTKDPDKICDWLTNLAAGRGPEAIEYAITRPDGHGRMFRNDGRPIVDPDGTVRRLSGTVQDVTEQRILEQQFVQAQKMEAVGHLTGGVAHDFNNLLAVVIGNLQLLRETMADDSEAADLCGDALAAGLRGAELTRRLLAFSRRQPLVPQPVDINRVVEETTRLLSRVLRADIAVGIDLSSDLPVVRVDPAQLESALTNLATNAMDAMPRGGRLTFSTALAELDDVYAASHPEVVAGRYVAIMVTDTGTGIAREAKDHIFEPFFTTKPREKGTGLGLSMVFGFIKQSGGHISVYSEPELGTTFRLYLPVQTAGDPRVVETAPRAAPVGGAETILLVEDDALVRRSVARQLSDLGYTVLEAQAATEAAKLLATETTVDLLLTDVVMPGGSDGVDLAERVRRTSPWIKVLLMSGFPEIRDAQGAEAAPPFPLIIKPFDRDQIAAALREVLDTPAAARDHGTIGDI